jgi:hypothetical protein
MNKNLCLIFTILLSVCTNSSAEKIATDSEICSVVQSVINLDKLQQYYHVDTFPERIPLNISVSASDNVTVSNCLNLEKFGQAVNIVSDNNSSKFVEGLRMKLSINDIKKTSMIVSFSYMPEGIKGEVTLLNLDSNWTIKESKIIEM